MSLLPENKPKTFEKTPKIFFIWGGSMSGKTYLARQFPNPLILNTDGNAKKVNTPSIEIKDFETFAKVLGELELGNHSYETIIIDLIDDIKTMLEVFVCQKNSTDKVTYESISEIPFGKGWSDTKSIWVTLMMRLSQLKYNICMISHMLEVTDPMDDSKKIQVPSLDLRYLNTAKGRCDAYIKCVKIGSTYLQRCEEKRDLYDVKDVSDKRLVTTLENVKGLFNTSQPLTEPRVSTDDDGNTVITAPKASKPVMMKKEGK